MKKTIFSIARALPCLFFGIDLIKKPKRCVPPSYGNLSLSCFQLDGQTTRNVAKLANREINLERLLRKKIIRLTTVLFFFSTTLFAQTKATSRQLAINDKVPNLTLSQILNFNQKSAEFSSFRNKALVLDFWATYCSPCIAEFPKMDAMQKKYGKNIQFLLMNTYASDTVEVLEKFLAAQKAKIKDFALPIILNSAEIKNVFPVNTMPHYIWIGADGRIKAITRADQLTEENVSRLIAGLSLNLKTKKD